jgi:hypothetical protein
MAGSIDLSSESGLEGLKESRVVLGIERRLSPTFDDRLFFLLIAPSAYQRRERVGIVVAAGIVVRQITTPKKYRFPRSGDLRPADALANIFVIDTPSLFGKGGGAFAKLVSKPGRKGPCRLHQIVSVKHS